MLITGGFNIGYTGHNSSELYLPSSGKSCIIPGHDKFETVHTQDNLLVCGGSDCLLWSSITGSWNKTITGQPKRTYHVSWSPSPEIGTYLIGGANLRGKVTKQKLSSLVPKPLDSPQYP